MDNSGEGRRLQEERQTQQRHQDGEVELEQLVLENHEDHEHNPSVSLPSSSSSSSSSSCDDPPPTGGMTFANITFLLGGLCYTLLGVWDLQTPLDTIEDDDPVDSFLHGSGYWTLALIAPIWYTINAGIDIRESMFEESQKLQQQQSSQPSSEQDEASACCFSRCLTQCCHCCRSKKIWVEALFGIAALCDFGSTLVESFHLGRPETNNYVYDWCVQHYVLSTLCVHLFLLQSVLAVWIDNIDDEDNHRDDNGGSTPLISDDNHPDSHTPITAYRNLNNHDDDDYEFHHHQHLRDHPTTLPGHNPFAWRSFSFRTCGIYYFASPSFFQKAGHVLFVFGSTIDVLISYMDLDGMEQKHLRRMEYWGLLSSVLWSIDAIFFILADSLEFHQYYASRDHQQLGIIDNEENNDLNIENMENNDGLFPLVPAIPTAHSIDHSINRNDQTRNKTL